MRLRLLIAILVGLGATTGVSVQTELPRSSGPTDGVSVSFPTTAEIIAAMVERAKRQDEAQAELAYESRIVTTIDTLNGDGEITETERTVHRRYPLENQLYEELIGRNGLPLSPKERQEEIERREEFAREARRSDGPVETNDERQIRLGDLTNRFDATVIGVETIDDEACWVVDFAPREGKLPEKTRIDQALNRSRGRIYIAQSDHGLRRVEFTMDRSIRYFLGLARLRHASGRLEFERVEPDVWLPKRYNFGIDLRVLFSSRRQQIAREWVERRMLASTAD